MANEWNKTAFVEFETMLRRHLRSGAAPVAACVGFDLDAASAYLEGALGEPRRAAYESHLAGCAVCRSHLIELSRLAQVAPSFESQPATTPDRISAWDRWKESVAVWFNFSARNLKWRVAGAMGAAFAILIAALGVQMWRQSSNRVAVAVNIASATPPPGAELPAQPLQSSTPEPLPQSVATPNAQDLNVNRQAPAQVPAPALSVGPIGITKDIPVEVSRGALAVSSNQPAEAPVVAKPSGVEVRPSPPQRLSAPEGLGEAGRAVLSDLRNGSNEQTTKEAKNSVPGLRPSPPPGLNPMKPGSPGPVVSRRGQALLGGRQARPNPEPNPKPSDKSTSLIKDVVSGIVKRNPLKWPFTSESDQKPIYDTQESSGMVLRFRGKVFTFDKGMWIDQEYKPEMQEWRRWTLTRDSEEYKRALAKEPLLKEFFDRAPILIVWKDEIYKVLK